MAAALTRACHVPSAAVCRVLVASAARLRFERARASAAAATARQPLSHSRPLSILSHYFEAPRAKSAKKPRGSGRGSGSDELTGAEGQAAIEGAAEDSEEPAFAAELTPAQVAMVAAAGGGDVLAHTEAPLTETHVPGKMPLADIVRDLEEGRAMRREVIRAVGESQEFADYDAEATLASVTIRAQYTDSKTPMTAARRHQMSAHAQAEVRAVMERHADEAAAKAAAAMTEEQKDRLRALFNRLESNDGKAWLRDDPPELIADDAAPTSPGADGDGEAKAPAGVEDAIKMLTDAMAGLNDALGAAKADIEAAEDTGAAGNSGGSTDKR